MKNTLKQICDKYTGVKTNGLVIDMSETPKTSGNRRKASSPLSPQEEEREKRIKTANAAVATAVAAAAAATAAATAAAAAVAEPDEREDDAEIVEENIAGEMELGDAAVDVAGANNGCEDAQASSTEELTSLKAIRSAAGELRLILCLHLRKLSQPLIKSMDLVEKMETILLKQHVENAVKTATNKGGKRGERAQPSGPAATTAGAQKPAAPKQKPKQVILKPLPPLYSVVVSGAAAESPAKIIELVQKAVKTTEKTDGLAQIRFKKIRADKGKVVIDTCSMGEREMLKSSAALEAAGLQTSLPERRRPRFIVQKVPADVNAEKLIEEIHARNFPDMDEEQFRAAIAVCRRSDDDGRMLTNVVVEASQELHAVIVKSRRVYVGFESLSIRNLEGVQSCYRCRSHEHSARSCEMKEMCCFRCGEEGHLARNCREPVKCRNCWSRKLPHNHLAASSACPIYGRALQRYEQRNTAFE